MDEEKAMGNVLIFAEHQDGKVKKTAFELGAKAAELASKIGGQAEAVLVGNATEEMAQQLAPYGVQKIYILENSHLNSYTTVAFVKVLADLVATAKPEILLAAASPSGRDVFPRLAARLNNGAPPHTH